MIRWPAYHAGYGAWIIVASNSAAMGVGCVALPGDDGEPLAFPTWAAALAWIEEHRG